MTLILRRLYIYTLFLSIEEVHRLPQDIDYSTPKSKGKIINVTGSEDVEF